MDLRIAHTILTSLPKVVEADPLSKKSFKEALVNAVKSAGARWIFFNTMIANPDFKQPVQAPVERLPFSPGRAFAHTPKYGATGTAVGMQARSASVRHQLTPTNLEFTTPSHFGSQSNFTSVIGSGGDRAGNSATPSQSERPFGHPRVNVRRSQESEQQYDESGGVVRPNSRNIRFNTQSPSNMSSDIDDHGYEYEFDSGTEEEDGQQREERSANNVSTSSASSQHSTTVRGAGDRIDEWERASELEQRSGERRTYERERVWPSQNDVDNLRRSLSDIPEDVPGASGNDHMNSPTANDESDLGGRIRNSIQMDEARASEAAYQAGEASRETASMKQMFAGMQSMMVQQQQQMKVQADMLQRYHTDAKNAQERVWQLENQAASRQKDERTLTINRSAEPWVTERLLQDDLQVPHIWWDVEHNRPETGWQSQLRARLFRHCCDQLPKSLWYGLCDGDVKGIYNAVVSIGQHSAEEQAYDLRTKVTGCHKGGRSMPDWLNELYDLWHQLSLLGYPADKSSCRQKILENLHKDNARYKDAYVDVMRNPTWELADIRECLILAATSAKDMSGSSPAKVANAAKKAEKKARKKAEKKANLAAAAAGAISTGTQAHAPPGTTGPSLAGGQKGITDPAQKAKMKREVCRYFLVGACTSGDSCIRGHFSIKQLQDNTAAAKAKKEKQKGNANANTPGATAVTVDDKHKKCNGWAANGTCTFGGNCKFSHADP